MTVATVRFEKRANAIGHFWTAPRITKNQLTAYLRGESLEFLKAASIGGEQESGFEQAFSSLAYAYIKDKSPRLIDYMVGFQLVDRNEDNTKAMGLFGFKVGDQWYYGPTFFLNGDLKGHELLFIKRQDAFVPLKENWVNYLISRKPHRLGEGSEKNTWELGGLPPDLMRLSTPPSGSKYGSDEPWRPEIQSWARPFLAFIGAAATKSDKFFSKHAAVSEALDLRAFLQNPSLAKMAIDLTTRYPLIKNGFDRFYGKNFFSELGTNLVSNQQTITRQRPVPPITKQADTSPYLLAAEPGWQHPLRTGELQIITDLWKSAEEKKQPNPDMDITGGMVLSGNIPEDADEAKEKFLHDGVLIQDKRDPHGDKVSVAYNTQVKMELQNPGETGIYEVLEKPGSFDRMLIIMHPHTNKGRRQFCTVIRLSDPRNWLNTHATNLWTKPCHCPSDQDWKKWFDKLDDKTEMVKGGYYLAVGPNGAATTPFRVSDRYDEQKYRVDFQDYTSWADRPRSLGKVDPDNDSEGFYISSYNAKLWINKKPGAGLRSVAGELAVPGNFKILKLQDPPKPKVKNEMGIVCCSPPKEDSEAGSVEKPIKPGNLVDIQLMIFEKTASLKLIDMGSEVFLKSPLGEQRLQKTAALVSLVKDHLFTEVSAREMLKTAACKGGVSYRVKYAQPNFSVLAGGPSSPAFPEPLMGMERAGNNSVAAIYPQEQFNMIPELQSRLADPAQYDPFLPPDQNTMMVAQQSAQSGQKEVFDTAMISGMLKAVRQDTLVDRYLGDLMKALDKLGRILFMFYWHQEEFEDRYGKQDLPELEDSIRNAFETLGDVCLFLKEKQVGSMADMAGVGNPEPNITEAARN